MKALLGLLLLAAGMVHAADMAVVRYVDQDPGDPPYPTRILVTADFLRMDGGEDGGDFVLLDRRQGRVINVMREAGVAMVFSRGELPSRPAGWNPRLDSEAAAPGTRRFKLVLDGVACSEGIAAAKAAPDTARAMAELKAVLAATQYRVWKEAPPEMQHACDLANQVWETGTTLGLGLPLEEREFSGRTRTFESESREPLRPELFRVPERLTAIDAPS